MLERLFRRTSCPIPAPASQRACLRPRHVVPLIGFLVPNVIIGYGFVLPRNGAGGLNELSIGFALALAGAALTYAIGVFAALRR